MQTKKFMQFLISEVVFLNHISDEPQEKKDLISRFFYYLLL